MDRKRRNNTVMIWTPSGCWFQTRVDGGRTVVCELGRIGSQLEVMRWCRAHGIEFDVFSRGAELREAA